MLFSGHRLHKNMEIEQSGLRENPPGSVAVQKKENCEKSLGERIQNCGLQCKDRAVDGESVEREEAENCEVQQQQHEVQETDVLKKQPEEELLDPRIQVQEK